MRRLAFLLIVLVAACAPEVSDQTCTTCDAMPEPVCNPGETEPCYLGAPGTEDIGTCHGGQVTCSDAGQWGACEDQVTPHQDVCGNGLDENCDGTADNELDTDGDGFTNCTGDCCDAEAEGCGDPELVNPGAFEASGNTIDDDCDGTADNVLATCDNGLASNSSEPLDYAKAIDLCQTATEDKGDFRWGVISARYTLADGTGAPTTDQRSIRNLFGATTHQGGQSLVVMSTGNAAATGQTNPSFASFQPGRATPNASPFPADWIAAHNNVLPNSPGCPAPMGSVANDPVMLELKIRTPTNAKSFSLSTNFFSSEYPEWTCSPFNDFFIVLLDSGWAGEPANPEDKNLAIYTSSSGDVYPVGVNLAFGDTGLFRICEDGATGCATGANPGVIHTCSSTTTLTNTGFDVAGAGCGNNDRVGGATGWLSTRGNVNGGEIITLRIAVWDTSDHALDSVALVDNFEWSVEASDPGTVIDVN